MMKNVLKFWLQCQLIENVLGDTTSTQGTAEALETTSSLETATPLETTLAHETTTTMEITTTAVLYTETSPIETTTATSKETTTQGKTTSVEKTTALETTSAVGIWSEWQHWTYTTEDFCYGNGVTGRFRTRHCTTEPTISCLGDSREEFVLDIAFGSQKSIVPLEENEQECAFSNLSSFTGLKFFCAYDIITGDSIFWTGLKVDLDLYDIGGTILLYKDDGNDGLWDSVYVTVTDFSWLSTLFISNLLSGIRECVYTSDTGILNLGKCSGSIAETNIICDYYKKAEGRWKYTLNKVKVILP